MRFRILFFNFRMAEKNLKRGSNCGFDGGAETKKRKKNWMKNKVRGDWRKVSDENIKVEYTILTRLWTVNQDEDDVYEEKHIAPWGVVKEITNSLKSENVGNSYNTLPVEMKNHFPDLTAENFTKEAVKSNIVNAGNLGFGSFSYLYCSICNSNLCFHLLKSSRTCSREILSLKM